MRQHVRWMPRLAALWLVGVGAGLVVTGCGGDGSSSSLLPATETAGSSTPETTGNDGTGGGSTTSDETASGTTDTANNGGPTTGSTGTGTTTSAVLTQDEATAADASDQSGIATNGALEPVSYLTESEGGRSVTRAEGEYPVVSTERTEDGFVVTVDYGTTPVTAPGGREVSGVFTITRNRVARTGSVVFTDVTINGRAINGSTSLTNLEVNKDGVSSTLTYDLTIGGVGRSTGTSSIITERATRLVTITTGLYTITPEGGGNVYSVVPDNIVLDPVNNRNMVPESGTRTIRYDIVRTNITIPVIVVVTYTADSPSTGVVSVSTNNGEPTPHTLPRFL
ncbi:MAG: hypothetical protein H7145_22320 [Akkermansiaceae bacterium]|nr:hypothetical protein [Armatimonadota bacterium]